MVCSKSAKRVLRQQMHQIIKNINIEDKRRQSLKVWNKLHALPQFQFSQRISIFLSTCNEIDTTPILKHMFETKKEVFIPRYNGKHMEMVKLSCMNDYEKLPFTKHHIKQPNLSDSRENALKTGGLDLIILPGLAFTRDGKRLGHGMGYYDYFLLDYIEKKGKKPYLVGLAFNEQVIEHIPTTKQDVNCDIVISEK